MQAIFSFFASMGRLATALDRLTSVANTVADHAEAKIGYAEAAPVNRIINGRKPTVKA